MAEVKAAFPRAFRPLLDPHRYKVFYGGRGSGKSWSFATVLISLAAGFRYTDTTNGFRGYSRRLLCDPRIEPLRECFVHFNIQYYLSVMAPALKFRVVEIPVERVYPDDGTVPTKVVGLRRNFQALWEMVLTVFRHYNPQS